MRSARVLAALVVGLVGLWLSSPFPPAAAADPGLAELVEQLATGESSARTRALNELRNRKDPKVIPLLTARIATLDTSPQYYALLILDSFGEKELRKPLRGLLKCESPYVRLCAAQILATYDVRGMPGVIERELSDPELPRAEWRRMMVRLRYGRLPKDDGLVAALAASVVVDADDETIRETAYVFDGADIAGADASFEALHAAARAGVRAVAAAFLRARGHDSDAALAAAFRAGEIPSSDTYFIQGVLTDASASPPGPDVVLAIVDGTRATENASNLRAIVQLLGRLSDRRALPRLRELAEHETATVAKAAADAVAQITGTKPAIGSSATPTDAADTTALTEMLTKRDRDGLAAWLTDKDATRRLSAADALRRMDDHVGLPQVLDEVVCENAVHRRSAVQILGKFRVSESVAPLIEALLDPDSTVRSYARSGLQATLSTLFPNRRFSLSGRGRGVDTESARTREAALLHEWWAAAQSAAW